jgi:hypothetical protein
MGNAKVTENRDKRTVSTDALETLGSIIGDKEKRDAIHLAVEPVTAGETIWPGQNIGLHEGKAYATGDHRKIKALGIADPFLKNRAETGSRFWLIIYPRQITSLRHVWSHPDFEEAAETAPEKPLSSKEASEKWLREFIANADCPSSYDLVVSTALTNKSSWSEEYLHFQDSDAHGDIPPEFWDHIEVVTGVIIPAENRAKYFSCSC